MALLIWPPSRPERPANAPANDGPERWMWGSGSPSPWRCAAMTGKSARVGSRYPVSTSCALWSWEVERVLIPLTIALRAAHAWKNASTAGRVAGFETWVSGPWATICDGGSPEISVGTSTSTPSVASAGSCGSKTCVTSQPPSASKVTKKCGALGSARATRRFGSGSAARAAVVRPSRMTARRVSGCSRTVHIVVSSTGRRPGGRATAWAQ
jgi:hypothetical protein